MRKFSITLVASTLVLFLSSCDSDFLSKMSWTARKSANLGQMAEGLDRQSVDTLHAMAYGSGGKHGDTSAQVQLGYLYYYGKGGLVEDKKRAEALFEAAARQGHALAAYNIGLMYYRGEDGRDKAQAIKWFTIAATARPPFSEAQIRLGEIYEREDIVKRDMVAAAVWYEMAAAGRDTRYAQQAAYKVGWMLWKGEGREQNIQAAVKALTQSANGHVYEAQYLLGYIYGTGDGIPKDTLLSAYWLVLAEMNHPEFKSKIEDFLLTLPKQDVVSARNKAAGAFRARINLAVRQDFNKILRETPSGGIQ